MAGILWFTVNTMLSIFKVADRVKLGDFFLYSTNRHFSETYLISIGNHRWSFFLTYYFLFPIFSSSSSEFLSFTDGEGVAHDVISTYKYKVKTAYLRDIKSPLLDDRKI